MKRLVLALALVSAAPSLGQTTTIYYPNHTFTVYQYQVPWGWTPVFSGSW